MAALFPLSLVGDIIYLNALGTSIIAINSYQVAQELMGKRVIYNDRPRSQFLGELMGLNRIVALCPYNDLWRRCRKMMHPVMSKAGIEIYGDVQRNSALTYLRTLLAAPQDFYKNARLCVLYLIPVIYFERLTRMSSSV